MHLSSPSARPLVQLPSFNSLLTNIGNMPVLSHAQDDTTAHCGRARLTSSPVHYHSPARPRTEQSTHAAPPQGLMPPAQIRSGHDLRTPERSGPGGVLLVNVDPRDLDAAKTLALMRSGGTPRKPEASQSSTTRTPDRPRVDSSKMRSSPYARPSPSQAQRTPAQPSTRKSMSNLRPIRPANAQPSPTPAKQDPANNATMHMASLVPTRTLRPLHPINVNFVPMFYPNFGHIGKIFDLHSAFGFQFGERGLPLDKVKLKQMCYHDIGLDVQSSSIFLIISWRGYPHEIGTAMKQVQPVHGFSELSIAVEISAMIEELQARVYKSGVTIDPEYRAYEINKKMRSKRDGHSFPLTTTPPRPTDKPRPRPPSPAATRKHAGARKQPELALALPRPADRVHKNKRGVLRPTTPRAARHALATPPR
ncbi:hypothetical protein BD410DRAFT_800205 [Rickenella mellea]|uniref:Uncharacterized protein n=1 Tax=Rickenella mellea TaxID=50990 RepID=A0A4Y7QIG8_9AGAM|nr:hypothetical protein BD410DRAFT_800205 [Rickenella mellea]